MRIALFSDTYSPQVNGVARTLQRLLEHASDRGHEVALVTPRLARPEPAATPHVELRSLELPFYPDLRLALPLSPKPRAALGHVRPDVVHVATEFTAGWSGISWASDLGTPLITSFHTDWPAYLSGYGLAGLERPMWHWLRTFHAHAGITLCPSRATRQQLIDAGFRHDLRVWSRGVDAALFHPDRRTEADRQRLGGGARHLLVFVGRLAPEKRLEVLLDAFALLRDRGLDVALAVVGDGPSRDDLQRRAGPGVRFPGFLEGVELAAAYAAADVFVFPSDTETFGNVVLEAMAAGVPVVAPDRGGVTDTVRDGVNGRLVPPGDPRAVADAVASLLARPALRRRLGSAARRYAESRSWPRILDGVLDIYAEAAASRPALVA